MNLKNEDFLLANVAALPAWLDEFDACAPAAVELDKWHAKLHGQASSVMQRIGRAFREHGGYSTIGRRRGVEGPAGLPSPTGEEAGLEQVQLARLAGEPMTNRHFHPTAAHAKLRRRLVALLGGRDGKLSDAALSEVLGELSDSEEKLAASAKEIRAWSRDAVKFLDGLTEARRFFSQDNLAALKIWGAHEENGERFVADPMQGSVTFRGIGSDHATVAVPKERIPTIVSFATPKDA